MQDLSVAIGRILASAGVAGMLVAALATVADVLMRWFFNTGITALNEIVTLAIILAVMACLPLGFATGVGVTINLLEAKLSRASVDRLAALGAVAMLVVFGALAWWMGLYANRLLVRGSRTMILGLPEGPFVMGAAVLLGLAALAQACRTVVVLRDMIRSWGSSRLKPFDIGVWMLVAAVLLGMALLLAYPDIAGDWARSHQKLTIVIGFLLLWVLLLALIPMAAAIAIVGFLGTTLFIGIAPTSTAFAVGTIGFLNNYEMAALPLFLLMGSLAAVAGVTDDLYRLAQAVLGRFRGGLAMATIGGSAGFGMVTGSSLATVATFGRIAMPQMLKRNYSAELASGSIAAGGTLGALIPPSGPLILFALLAEASIGQLFVAAMIPALLSLVLYLATVMILVRTRPDSAPPAEAFSIGEFRESVAKSLPVLALFAAVIGGMYAGLFTPTEAAAVGASGAFLIALLRGKFRLDQLSFVIRETTGTVAMIYSLIFGTLIFSFLVGISGASEQIVAMIGGLDLPPMAIIALLILIYLLLGALMDSYAVMIITIPIVTPIILHLGYDIVWWGIINLVILELGMITPPFGIHIIVVKSMTPALSLGRIYRGVMPFVTADAIKLALLLLIPAIALWLPSTMH